jgi:seryl-tRNA synthetase
MAAPVEAFDEFRTELIDGGVLTDTGVSGLYGRSGEFEDVIDGLNRMIAVAAAPDAPQRLRFPPIIARATYEATDHLTSFPDLMGAIHGFRGGEPEHRALRSAFETGQDWAAQLSTTNLMLCPAACYPLYPTMHGQPIEPTGKIFDVVGYCFRHEPSPDPARMQSFRMHENVFVGGAENALAFRDRWIERGLTLLGSLGLDVRAEVANDPFFGRAGRMLKANQVETTLKYELVVPICSTEFQTAIASANCHLDHLTNPFDVRLNDGSRAQSACVGFGLERVALALFKSHGLAVSQWPASVRAALLL